MCVVIDPSCLPKMFDSKNSEHDDFKSVKKWLTEGPGRMVWGGSKYSAELSKLKRYFGTIVELRKSGRARILPDETIDQVASALKQSEPNRKFNDEHLVAIAVVSRCSLICTSDRKASPYLRKEELYAPFGVRRPKIYTRKNHRHLLHKLRCTMPSN